MPSCPLSGPLLHWQGADLITGDVFYFDYGVLVMWGLTEPAEREVIRSLAGPALVDPLPPREVEVDEFRFHYTMHEKPHIQNDTFTSEAAAKGGKPVVVGAPATGGWERSCDAPGPGPCTIDRILPPTPTTPSPSLFPLAPKKVNYRLAKDHLLKLSISHALAQSTKLTVYEERVVEIVESTKELPVILATTGTVKLSRKRIAQLIGRVFLQKSAVNLLSTVLDTPEFFWSAPDAMQSLYKRVCDYVEYDARVEVLNSRFQVLQEMLDMLRDHQNNGHGARLEWIVIWLIVVEVVVGLFECASILGWVG